MRRSRHTARQLFGLTLTLVGLMSWNTLPIHLPERTVQAATRVRVTEPTGQQVSRPVANGRVAFASSEGNANPYVYTQSDIYTMNPDGSDRKQLTFSQDFEDQPVWSPDGTKIAFARFNNNISEIFVMNADGSDQRRLTQSKFDRSPTWSPDGTQIAFWSLDSITMPRSRGIFVMNADGSDQRAVASTSNFYGPAWSPDGLKFAVGDDGTLGTGGIHLINVDGSSPTQITQPPGWPNQPPYSYDSGPAWSPDGSKITFARCVDSDGWGCYTTSHLWAVNADGSNPTKLTDVLASTHAWSPDGTKIIFGSVGDSLEPRDLFVMNPDGSGLTNITNTDSTREWSPSWQPLPLTLPNPIDDPEFFVRQHYLDFLNREPDAAGLAFWTNEITSCGADAHCVEAKRVNVSAAFFLSIEFQETGFYAMRLQRAAFGKKSREASRIAFGQFLSDAGAIGAGVIVQQPGYLQLLEQNKQNYSLELVSSAAFISRFPTSLSATDFVNALYDSARVTPTQTELQNAIVDFGGGDTEGRTAALRRVAESNSLTQAELNPSFVLMQYFGYLRRDPDASGYDFWLAKLEEFNGNYIQAEMVKSFLVSGEYRGRFPSQ